MTSTPTELWEIHLRIPAHGPVAIASKRGGEPMSYEVVRSGTPCDALRRIEDLLSEFAHGQRLFITARTHDHARDTSLSMWFTASRAAGLYWCAAALGKLWRSAGEPPLLAASAQR